MPGPQPPREPPRRGRAVRTTSLVVVNTGDGKGKTTAAMGTVLRAVARGWRVCVIQFIKSGRWRAGEEQVARRLGVEWWTMGDGFSWESEDLDRSAALARAAWEAAKEKMSSGDYELVVLDEVTYPVATRYIAIAVLTGLESSERGPLCGVPVQVTADSCSGSPPSPPTTSGPSATSTRWEATRPAHAYPSLG